MQNIKAINTTSQPIQINSFEPLEQMRQLRFHSPNCLEIKKGINVATIKMIYLLDSQ